MKYENESASELLLGFSQADITPKGSVQTVGFGRADEYARGVRGRLIAQVSTWRLGDETGCLIAIDHIGFSIEHANALRDEIGEILNVAREKVMLCFSHTHSAPNDSIEANWFDETRQKIAGCAKNAAQAMTPVFIAWGNARTTIGVNRRAENAEMDDRIGILKVVDAKTGANRLALLRLTAHANVLKGDNYDISPDYFGSVRDALSEKLGCPVMLTQGASGDVAPRYFDSEITPPDAADDRFIRSKTALADMAREVAADALPVWEALRPRKARRFRMYARVIELNADVPTIARAREIAEEALRYCGIDGNGWMKEVERLNETGIQSQTDSAEIQYFALDDGCLCGVPYEILCGFALRASEMLGDDFFYFGGYTNGSAGYLPTEEAFDEGGYEVYWSMLVFYMYYHRVFPFRRESASQLIRFAADNAPR